MTAVFRVLWPFTRGRRTAFASGLAGTLLVTASELARPFPLKFVLDRLLARDATPVRPAFVVGVAALVVAIALFGAAGTYLAEAGPRRAGEHVVHDLRVAIYAHLQRLSLRYHRRTSAGDLVTRLTGDVHAVGELVTESLVKLGGAILLLAGMLVVGVLLDPILTLAAIAITPLLAFATVVSRRTVKAAARKQRTAEGAIASLATESLTAIDTVKALGNEASEAGRLRGRSEQRRDASVAGVTAESRYAGVVGLLEAVGTAVVLGVGVLRVTAGAITAGDLVVMHSYVRRLYRPLRDLARQTGRVSRSLVRGERIAEVLASDETLPERPGAHAGGRSSGHVELRDVHFSYTPGRPALRGLTLDIAPGSTVAVVGSSGAGKSTLAALVGRFYDPDRGAVVLDGRDLRDCSLGWLRTQVGFVLQDTATFSGTVAENIAFGTDAAAAQIVTAARVAGADDFVTELPDGYGTDLGAGGANLSGGQRQRLSIARTLLRDPAVVVLDEPTTGLDATSERAVASSIARLLEGRTTILITHALRLARRADRVIVLDRGRIVDDGRPEDLITGDGAFRRLAVAQGLASPAPPPAPHDPALPHLARLLDAGAAAEILSGHTDRNVTSASVRYIRYKPNTNAVVDYDVETNTGVHRAVLMIAADRNLAKRASAAANQSVADRARDRAPSTTPLAFDECTGALVQWLPVDLWLPALAEPPAELAHQAGLAIAGDEAGGLLAYKPRRRAVVRVDGHVLKLYPNEACFRSAARALLASTRLPVPTPAPAGICARWRVTAQSVLDGAALGDGVARARDVGAVLADLHRAALPDWRRRLDPLTGAMASAGTLAHLVPAAAPRLQRLVARLVADAPPPGDVLCHGDFHAAQMLVTPDGLAVLDLDELGRGAPAIDVATYAAHLLDGTGTDDVLDETVDGLLAGYGTVPADLGWHLSVALLRRAVFPFRKDLTSDWPERVDNMIGAAEGAIAR